MRILLLSIALLVVGVLALPVAASLLDGSETGEDLVLPVQVLLTTAVGAGLGRALLGRDPAARRAMLTGAGIGLLAALVGMAAFFLVLNGFDGA
ncbi:hypothetical protein ACJ5H2_19465 [Nocardioides sp. R1-1]|uniref:hypothetical protein n=1 Tax=Nocardioides sp. R1-1 TaxID=3383502 RepID=UPI0038CFF23F